MRKFILTLMASLLSCSAAHAFWPEASDSSLEIGVGYRHDSLKWKTEVDLEDDYTGYPTDTLGIPLSLSSELEWKNLNIWQIEARGKYVTCDNIYLRASGDYGWVTGGKRHDKDSIDFFDDYFYGYDIGFRDSHSDTKGHVYDAKLAVGYQFSMCDDSFSIAPLVGYSWHGQHLKNHHDVFGYYNTGTLVYEETYYGGYYEYYTGGRGESSYHTRWNGPFIGFDFEYAFWCDWSLFGGYEFHWAEFHAKSHWNDRDYFFDGFHHRAKHAYGQVFDIGLKWDFCECWTLALKGEFQWWCAHHGRDRAKIAEDSFGDVRTSCFLSIPLKDIRWDSQSVSIDIGMVF